MLAAVNTGEHPYIRYHIAGVVHGAQDDFVQYFTGEMDNTPYYFDIQPDGVIQFHQGIPPRNTGFTGSGLASKVQMPGKIILIEDTTGFTPEKLRSFKDKQGKSMEDYFQVLVKEGSNGK